MRCKKFEIVGKSEMDRSEVERKRETDGKGNRKETVGRGKEWGEAKR